MFQIICPSCSNKNVFETAEKKPLECSFCFTTFNDTLKVEEIADEKKGALIGLKLVFQQNSESITFNGNSCILGRENTGSQLLSAIRVNGNQVISRKHCSIYLSDGKYLLKDEGSLNGTFYGVSKIDCSKEAQIIENNSMIFLGKEAFLVQYQYEETKIAASTQTADAPKEAPKPKKYRCKEGCGYESETYADICPKCIANNSLVPIYDN
jgi:hypothetical protein